MLERCYYEVVGYLVRLGDDVANCRFSATIGVTLLACVWLFVLAILVVLLGELLRRSL